MWFVRKNISWYDITSLNHQVLSMLSGKIALSNAVRRSVRTTRPHHKAISDAALGSQFVAICSDSGNSGSVYHLMSRPQLMTPAAGIRSIVDDRGALERRPKPSSRRVSAECGNGAARAADRNEVVTICSECDNSAWFYHDMQRRKHMSPAICNIIHHCDSHFHNARRI